MNNQKEQKKTFNSLIKAIFIALVMLPFGQIIAKESNPLYDCLGFSEWKTHDSDGFVTRVEEVELEKIRLIHGSQNIKPAFEPATKIGMLGVWKLMSPTNNRQTLQASQDFIKLMLEDESFATELSKLLAELAKNEADMVSYWTEDKISRKAQSHYFWQPKTFFGLFKLPDFVGGLNRSAGCLEASIVLDVGKRVSSILAIFALKGLIDEFAKAKIQGRSVDYSNVLAYPEKMFKAHWPFSVSPEYYQMWKDGNHELHALHPIPYVNKAKEVKMGLQLITKKLTLRDWINSLLFTDFDESLADRTITLNRAAHLDLYDRGWYFDVKMFGKKLSFPTDLVGETVYFPMLAAAPLAVAAQLVHTWMYYKTAQEQVELLQSTYHSMENVHRRMIAVSQYIKTAEKIEALIEKYAQNGGKAALFAEKCLITVKPYSEKMQKLIKLLHTGTFNKKKAKLLYSRGTVLHANKLLEETHNELIDRLRNLAVIDAHVAVAHFMKKCQTKGLPICFVDFIEDDKPVELFLENAWLPLTILDSFVTNTIHLGGDKARILILTGPNGCGKSTILKTMGVAALLAHCFGIAPATMAHMSLVDGIRTSLQINDNMDEGLSTYMAADEAVERLRIFINSLEQNGKRGFVFCGEPYRGTPESETARKIINFGKEIVDNKRFVMGLETHVFEPTKLETEFPQDFGNGHMHIEDAADGSFIRTFKLADGPAHWWFFDVDRRAKFVDWITVLRKQLEEEKKAFMKAVMAIQEKKRQAQEAYEKKLKEQEKRKSVFQKIKDSLDI
ncbi:hypothetical protein IPH25_02155 [bacterium]|nr:MAG: hypothetical protein IPG37_04285 [bacterium]QQR62226.1 MAG: hypothetical protein IPH25_02155 [bacterium]